VPPSTRFFLIILAATCIILASIPSIASSDELTKETLRQRLEKFPPLSGNPERQAVLTQIDSLFTNDSLSPLKLLLADFISEDVWEISSSPTPTPRLWYIWNMGYVFKTGKHVIGFDLPEVLLSPLSDEQKKILGQSLDILFISHVDTPHVDRDLISYMRGDSYVVCPSEVVSFFDPIVDRKCSVVGIDINETKTIGSARIRGYFGDDRRGTPMRCFLVTIDGFTLLHTGDQHYAASWMKELSRKVDVLMMGPMEREEWNVEALQAISPRFFVPGGIYDMSHPKDTWEGYPYAFRLRSRAGPSVVPLFFGESLQIRKKGTNLGLPAAAGTIAVLAIASILIVRARPTSPRRRKASDNVAAKCERRYVEEICLKCKFYAIRGGRPFCARYNFHLDSDKNTDQRAVSGNRPDS